MKKSKVYLLSLLCFIILSSCKTDVNGEYSETEIENMIRKFYIAYISESISSIPASELQKKLDSITQIYCTKSLLDSIDNEFKNNELDYDPFLNAQDSSPEMLKTLSIHKRSQKENIYTVMYLSDKYDSTFTKIYLTISKIDGKYKVSGIK